MASSGPPFGRSTGHGSVSPVDVQGPTRERPALAPAAWRRLVLRFGTPGLLVAGLIAFLATAVASLAAMDAMVLRYRQQDQALEARRLAGRVGMLLVDIETGVRGFLITGRDDFLEPRNAAMREIEATLAAFKQHWLAAGNAGRALDRLDGLMKARMTELDRTIRERRAQGSSAQVDLPASIEGKRLMDEIRGELARLDDLQRDAALRSATEASRAREKVIHLGLLLGCLGLLLVGFSLALSVRDRRRRDLAQHALAEANATLESQVAERTRELQEALQRIQSFAGAMDRGIEAERRRLAREVHDQFGQIASAMKFMVGGLPEGTDASQARTRATMLELCDTALATARRITTELRPPLLDDFGLAAAVAHQAEALGHDRGFSILVDVIDDEVLTADQASQLFRIFQEASANTLRHAQASTLRVVGRHDEGTYRFEMTDDGVGPRAAREGSSGLRNMRERAGLIGGSLSFGKAPRGGTQLVVAVPLQPEITAVAA